MAKREFEIWDVLFWIGMLILIGYVIAKLTGLINTPEWVELIPIITIIFVSGVFYQKVVGFMERILNRTDYLKNNMDIIANKLNEHDKQLFIINKQQETFTKLLSIKT